MGAYLRRLREARGLSQETVAKRVGWVASYVSKVENGKVRHLDRRTIRALARALEADPSELLRAAGYWPDEEEGTPPAAPRQRTPEEIIDELRTSVPKMVPLIEQRGVPREGGPLAVMLEEHQQSRDLLARLTPLAEDFIAGRTDDPRELHAVYSEYTELLKNHFWKENDILYPMARRVMSDDDAAAVVQGIEAAEAALGEGTRD